ncbi:MAG: Rdx family protein [Anaerolineae bacterium]|nr:Rdx family protein [Anaerolineae bacterium]
MSLTAELLDAWEMEIKSLILVPADGGVFEVKVDSDLVFSKKASGRHAEPGEVKRLIQARRK